MSCYANTSSSLCDKSFLVIRCHELTFDLYQCQKYIKKTSTLAVFPEVWMVYVAYKLRSLWKLLPIYRAMTTFEDTMFRNFSVQNSHATLIYRRRIVIDVTTLFFC